jgi:hypothetical protein
METVKIFLFSFLFFFLWHRCDQKPSLFNQPLEYESRSHSDVMFAYRSRWNSCAVCNVHVTAVSVTLLFRLQLCQISALKVLRSIANIQYSKHILEKAFTRVSGAQGRFFDGKKTETKSSCQGPLNYNLILHLFIHIRRLPEIPFEENMELQVTSSVFTSISQN